jgi:protein-S-isoprenylcysteine O-methyltransferase Ste14
MSLQAIHFQWLRTLKSVQSVSGVPMSVSMTWMYLYYGWIASEVVIALATRTGRNDGNVKDKGTQALLWVVILASATASEWIRHVVPANLFGGAGWLRMVGLILLIAGLAIRWTAVLTLGKAFSANVAIRASQTVRKNGLYRFVRHPSYLGLLLIFLAVGVHSRNWLSLAVMVLPTTAALLYRIHVEEAALREAFGEEYVAYSRETKRLIPWLF